MYSGRTFFLTFNDFTLVVGKFLAEHIYQWVLGQRNERLVYDMEKRGLGVQYQHAYVVSNISRAYLTLFGSA